MGVMVRLRVVELGSKLVALKQNCVYVFLVWLWEIPILVTKNVEIEEQRVYSRVSDFLGKQPSLRLENQENLSLSSVISLTRLLSLKPLRNNRQGQKIIQLTPQVDIIPTLQNLLFPILRMCMSKQPTSFRVTARNIQNQLTTLRDHDLCRPYLDLGRVWRVKFHR